MEASQILREFDSEKLGRKSDVKTSETQMKGGLKI